ncbi:G-D-S-L family lipolytic protein [Croceivirga radicis]|uniref:G-D-S-L family lipolytic protein n=1 Tax=Croceivirga radicis TaxID=1929488 RepID=A0A1V6LQC3_9FLAO|nr:SGNH/GDSL hydrolase family protein [Croceivirga radicis]OQD42383.1 G-D-S-L family lipolytic protein [Croceivirga radicis]
MLYRISILLFLFGQMVAAQAGFENEVKTITAHNDSIWNQKESTIVFTGSSSIRMWKDLQERFPDQQVLNTGFGGSQASDLLYFLDDLVLKYKPKTVFIYEGDNDISAKKRPKEILGTLQEIIQKIKKDNPETNIVLISAKPSISRWKLRSKYKRLNRKLEKLAQKEQYIDYADVWYAMLDGKKLRTNLFIADGLHMNKMGYDIWYYQLKPLIK